ncbi:MAG: ATPase domain-containing protein [Candidatus Hydrothermarchaeota archaeon]
MNRVSTGSSGLDRAIGGGLPKGSLILISGEPGTGKTTFVLQYAFEHARMGEKVLYISTSESIPKIMRFAENLAFYDKSLVDSGMINFMDFSASKLVDEVETVKFGTFIKQLGRMVEENNIEHVIIDPITLLALVYEKELDFRRNILLLGSILDKCGCTTILTSEIPKGSELLSRYGFKEFIVDGVFILSRYILDERTVRKIHLEKLRGTEIKQPNYLITLKDGFKVMEPFKYSRPEKPKKWEPVSDSKTHFSTGSEELDSILGGGYRVGGFVLIDVGEGVPPAGYRLFNYLPALNFISQGRGCEIITVGGADAEEVRMRMAPFVSLEDFNRLVRIVERRMPDKDQNKPYIVTIEGESLESDREIWLKTRSELREKTKKPLYFHWGYDVLEYRYPQQDLVEFTSENVSMVKGHGDLGIAVTKPGLKSTQELANMANIHLKIVNIEGSVVFYGIQPRTELYNVDIDVSRGYPKLKLTPIV